MISDCLTPRRSENSKGRFTFFLLFRTVEQLIPFAKYIRVVFFWGSVQQAHVIVRHGPTLDFKRVVRSIC